MRMSKAVYYRLRKFMALTLFAATIVAVSPIRPATAAAPTEAIQPAVAYAAAKKSGKPVEISSLKSPTTVVWAQPNGHTIAEVNAVPVRLKRDGAWLDFDMTLQRRPDGTIAPKVHPKDLVLSGAAGEGEHDLATVTVNGERVGMGWRGRLPEPRLSGDTATYPEVMPGIDLTLKAGASGFEQFFIVKERSATARMAGLRLPMRTGHGAFSPKPDGTGEWLSRTGSVVARMPLPLIWDAKAPEPSGERLRKTRMGLQLKASEAELVTDRAWFDDPETTYPVTVDPGLVLDPGAGFDEFVQNTINISDNQGSAELKVGYSDSSDCLAESSQGCRTRSYLRFDGLSGFRGVRIFAARLNLWEFHSWSCTAFGWRATRTDNVTGSVQWGSEPAWRETASTTNETKGYSTSCNDGWVSTDVAPLVDDAFANGWSSLSMVIHSVGDNGPGNTAWGVSDHNSWKKFDSNEGAHRPTMHLEYDHIPEVSNVTVQDDGSCGVGAGFRKYLPTTTLRPTFKAFVKDDDKAPNPSTNVKLEVQLTPAGGSPIGATSQPAAPNGFVSVAPSQDLDTTKVYTYQVRPMDLNGDGSVMEYGSWSSPCEIAFDSATISAPPTIEGLSEFVDDDGDGVPNAYYDILDYGISKSLRFRPDPADVGKVAAYRYGFSEAALASPNAQTVPAGPDGSAVVPIARWEVDGQGFPTGDSILHVRAVTVTGAREQTRSVQVWQNRPLDQLPPVTHVRGDLNGDGAADLAGHRDLSATEGLFYSYYGSNNGSLADRAYVMKAPYVTSNSKVAQGDFNGDGKTDFAVFVMDGANDVKLKALTSDGIALKDVEVWSSKVAGAGFSGQWSFAAMKVLAGDADADGKDDLIVAYGNATSWMLKSFLSYVDTGANPQDPHDDQLRFANPANWLSAAALSDWNKLKLVVGEFNNSPGADVAEFYDHGSCRTVLYMHEKVLGENRFTAGSAIWDSNNTSQWCWGSSQFAAGHYGAASSGTSGIVASYDFGGCNMGIYTFSVEYIGTPATPRWFPHIQQWTSGSGTTYWCAGSTQLDLRDITGDGREDLLVSYRCCGPSQQRIWTFNASGPTYRVFVFRDLNGNPVVVYASGTDTLADPVLKAQGAVGPIGVGDVKYTAGTTRYQLVAKHSGLCVSVHDGVSGASSAEGAVNTQQTCAAGILNGQFTLEQRGAAYVRLHPAHNPEKCLNVSGALADNGRPIIQNTCTPGQSNESWQIEYVTGASGTSGDPNELAVRLVTNLSGKCLDIEGASQVAGARVHQWDCGPLGQANQTFFLRPIAPTTGGLLANWKMSSTQLLSPSLTDSTGRKATATINANGLNNWQNGGVLVLNGTTGFARTNGSVINTSTSFTVSAWVNLDVVGGRYQTVVAQEGSNVSAFYLHATQEGKWGFSLLNTINGGTYSIALATSTVAAVTGTWVHLVGVYDLSTGQGRLYVNGVPDGAVAVTSGVSPSGNLIIGAAWSFGARVDWVDGRIDDVRAWERALSDSEIQALYAAGAS